MGRLASICSFLLVEVSVGIDEHFFDIVHYESIKKQVDQEGVDIFRRPNFFSINVKPRHSKKKNGAFYVCIENSSSSKPY